MFLSTITTLAANLTPTQCSELTAVIMTAVDEGCFFLQAYADKTAAGGANANQAAGNSHSPMNLVLPGNFIVSSQVQCSRTWSNWIRQIYCTPGTARWSDRSCWLGRLATRPAE